MAEDSSEEDVFFGKMTLKEVKKHIFMNDNKTRLSNIPVQNPVDTNNSISIIECHSQPNLRTVSPENTPILSTSVEHINSSDKTKMENLLSKLCISPEDAAKLELNNTFEVVEYILNNGPQLEMKTETHLDSPIQKIEHNSNTQCQVASTDCHKLNANSLNQNENKEGEKCIPIAEEDYNDSSKKELLDDEIIPSNNNIAIGLKALKADDIAVELLSPLKKCKPKTEQVTPKVKILPSTRVDTAKDVKCKTPKTVNKLLSKLESPRYFTPSKSPTKQEDEFHTPITVLQTKTPVFKTPSNPISLKKSAISIKYTPSKSHLYKHIESPVAAYINNPVEVPMISNVCPKKPLPGTSKIPKIVRSKNSIEKTEKSNKENINIPTTVFKNAKMTKIIQPPQAAKKPLTQSAKKLMSALPQAPVVLKHGSRQYNTLKKPLVNLQEDTVVDLSDVQADVSVCTQVNPTKKYR